MRRTVSIILLTLAVALGGCGESNKTAGNPLRTAEPVPFGPLPRDTVPLRYRLSFVIDPSRGSFVGHDEIDVRFSKPKRILFLHGQDLKVSGVVVRLPSGRMITAHYDQVDRSGVARLVFVDEIPRGLATLIFDYEAAYDRSLSGLYKVVDNGVPYVFTQFEPTDARRAFPSFDEPGFKTPFAITVTAPAADTVISNTEEASTKALAAGVKRVVFAPTKPLPTYLVALAVGPLDVVDGGTIPPDRVRSYPIPLRGITAKGEGARIRAALSLTPKIVLALEDYFGVPYPYAKLDMLAVPDFAAGAMENAGAVTFRERLMLFDAGASLDQKRTSLLVQAHELTHQWFGDLVTPGWWDDIWLNESFATWMSAKVAAEIKPDWQFGTETLRKGFDVMQVDELPSARKIRQPVLTSDDISEAFDGITYNKGASVLTMFESFLGEDAWRAGIRAYLTKHAFANATAKDFVDAIAQAAPVTPQSITIAVDKDASIYWNGRRLTGEAELKRKFDETLAQSGTARIAAAFNSYLDQPGVPLLNVATRCARGLQVDVAQSSYVPLGMHAQAHRWGIPLFLGTPGGRETTELMSGPSATVALHGYCTAHVLPNMGGKGYYRFTVGEKDWNPLIEAARRLPPADQITLLENLDAALRAGDASVADLFKLIRILAPTAEWDVLESIDGVLQRVRRMGLSDADQSAYRDFVHRTFEPRLRLLGFAERANGSLAARLTREVLTRLVTVEGGDPMTTAQLSAAAHAIVASGGEKTRNLAPDLLGDALRAGIVADPSFADALVRAYLATDDEDFRRLAIYAFSGSRNPAAIAKLLAVVPKMRAGELRYLYQYMSVEPVARTALWDWFRTNYQTLEARVSRHGMWRTVTILGDACDPAAHKALEDFFLHKVATYTGSARPLALAEEKIDRCVAFKRAKGGEIAAALKVAP